LVVDDDPEARLYSGQILREAGYTVFAAENAARCLKWLAVVQPSIIMLDVNMPETNGYELCATIRENYPHLNAAVLFVTSNRTVDDVMNSKRVGGNYFLTKPYTGAQLLEAAQKAFMVNRGLKGG
jgi:CheY-like chemotaxis protein